MIRNIPEIILYLFCMIAIAILYVSIIKNVIIDQKNNSNGIIRGEQIFGMSVVIFAMIGLFLFMIYK